MRLLYCCLLCAVGWICILFYYFPIANLSSENILFLDRSWTFNFLQLSVSRHCCLTFVSLLHLFPFCSVGINVTNKLLRVVSRPTLNWYRVQILALAMVYQLICSFLISYIINFWIKTNLAYTGFNSSHIKIKKGTEMN